MRACWLAIFLLLVGIPSLRADPALDAFDRDDYERALAHWMPAAHAGDATAQIGMARLWQDGLTKETPKNPDQAMAWYLQAARQGNVEAMVSLGALQWNSGNKTPALQWLSLAAQRGNQNARDLLTQMGQPVQDIEGMLAAQALAAQSRTSHPAINEGAADLGYALGCAIGGGCDRRSVDSDSLFETPDRPQQSYSYAPIRPHVSLNPITSPNYFGPQSPVPITDPNYHSPENRALRDLLNQQ